MQFKRNVLVMVICAILIIAAVFFLWQRKPTLRSVTPQPPPSTEGGTPAAKPHFVDVRPVTFHPLQHLEIPLPDGEALFPRVSPDGSRVVYQLKRGATSRLAVVELPSGAVSTPTIDMDDVAAPAWSADGSQVVFAGTRQGVTEIYLYNLKAKKLVQVTRDPARKKTWPRCSPYRFDEHYRIAYTSEEGGRKDIWWVRESGEYDQPITVSARRKPQYLKDPYWEKESASASAPSPITSGGENPEWSPSGNLLLYRTGQNTTALLAYTYYEWWHPAKVKVPSSPGILSWAPNQCSFLEYDPARRSAAVISRQSLKRVPVLAGTELSSPPSFFPDGQGFALSVNRGGKALLAVEPYADPLGDVANLWMFSFSAKDQDKLARNQMILQETAYDQIYSLYDSEAYSTGTLDELGDHGRPYFVTSDAVLETFYASFTTLYANAERSLLTKALTEFCSAGEAAARQKKSSPDVESLFSVGLALLKPETLKVASARVQEEVKRIDAATGTAPSLFGKEVAYGDFFIRGKYERDKDLKGYFRALKWLQSFTFNLQQEPDRSQAAAVLAVARDPKVYPALEKMFSLYRSVLGESRYRSPLNLQEIRSSALPEFKSGLPWIKGKSEFRLLPPVYTLDAFIFDELITHGERKDTVGTQSNPRMLPRGLDIMAVLGSAEAREILVKELKEGRYENYERTLDRVSGLVKSFPQSVWEASLYQDWLDLMASLTREPEKAPAFTKTAAWRRKQLNTALGSWVNLRYETIAMVEQVGAEAGEGGYEVLEVGRPRGYVEPNPEFFHTLDKAFERLATQFEKTVPDVELRQELRKRFSEHRVHLQALETIARKELNGEMPSDVEFEEILSIGGTVEHFMQVIASANGTDGEPLSNPEPMRKIVDVQKDDLHGVRLYEALGHAPEMDVVVPYFGRRQIAKGSIYSYYEFTAKESLDSKKWRKMKQPRPVWIKDYYGSATVAPMKTLDDAAGK
ncbi:DUF3160 domain-containing protein [Geomonas oryzisoli]|uniref:DUF3160 domain-containing protein n=1 Tax=Geomonas oryzisoli TaxID=2847992 RepID=A0ABX8J4X1_9BACT|nr:DUF3160 domain-containing protein [Geomonas oryzisoli]QWV92372.1 DUF3160 domain-containing protein [Geomonas oryzisoli]